jgi:tetratricopeptide (TPR) repeat protein
VFWVDGKSEARFSQSYGDIARKVGLSLESKAEDLWMAVKEWIEEQDNWLLVLDNVSDLGIYRKHNTCTSSSSELIRFIPKPQMGRRGAILWTARDGAILNLLIAVDQGLELGVMTVQESCSLLQKLCGQASTGIYSENEENLVQLSDRLPLAIAQVAAYIRKTKMSIQQYIALFNDSEDVQSDLLHLGFPDIYRSGFPNSVTEAWDDSMKQIRVETGLAHNILNTAAFFDNQGIPFGLFAAAANWPKAEIFRAAGRLVEHSFLKIQKTDADGLPIYEQHRLVQLATRNYLTVAEVNVYSIRALRLVAEVFPDGSYETWNTCKQYLPHSRKVLSWFENDESLNIVIENDEFQSVARLLAHTAMYYWTQGCYDEAEHFEVKLVDTQKSVLGNKHADTIGAMANLASTWWMQNCPDEAEYLQNEVLSMQKSVLGKKHPNTVVAMANLASIWWQQGRSDKAEKLQLEVLELQKTVLGEAHHHTILAMANLASIWWQQGRSYKAEDLDIETLSLLQAVLGESHPHTILAMSNLASTWWHQGSLGKAEDLDIEVLKLQKRVLGETHPDTVGAMRNLAITWYEQGRLDEAEELEGEIAELRKGGVAGESDLDPLRDLAASDRFSWHGFASDQNTWKPDDSLLARIPALAEAAFNNESMRLVRSRGIPPKSI